MNAFACWGKVPLLIAFALAGTASAAAAGSNDPRAIADTIKRDVAQLVAGLNAHDPVRVTAFDAADVISMECGRPSTVGIDADREGFTNGFASNPAWRVRLIDETVDVADSGDLAVYRGTYHEDSRRAGKPMTHKTNFLAEFKRQRDGSWKIVWYSVTNLELSHPR